MDIAVIGAGISGLGAALKLQDRHRVSVFESALRAGGHANTVDVTLDGICHPVDTGFLVYNERTYPGLIALFEALDVPVVPSDMSFAVSVGPHREEWCGSNLRTLLAQPTNLLRPGFWRMVRDILRFNREATALATGADTELLDRALGEHLERAGYSTEFRDAYLLPMAAAIWSCPMRTMLGFPLGSFVRFFHNHGLLQVADRPQWYTVRGGSRQYVDRIRARLADLRLGCPVTSVRRPPVTEGGGVLVTSPRGVERFDQVVMACHSDQTLALLTDSDGDERALLDAIPYQPNTAWLHTDTRLMPRRRAAWAAWNYLSNGDADAPEVSVTYWLNRLQPLPFDTSVFVSLNPLTPPAPEHTIARLSYEHPVFDRAAMAAQKRLEGLQGRRSTWFAGAWTGYGFHEDGLRSGLAVAAALNETRDEQRAAA